LRNKRFNIITDSPEKNLVPSSFKDRIRASAGIVILLCLCLSICAFAVRTPLELGILSIADIGLLICLSKNPFYNLWREGRMFVFQTALIVVLYLFRFGQKGALPGLLVSWQIFLAFLPGIILISSVPQSKLINALSKAMPIRIAFVLSVSLNFIPLLLSEFRSMYDAQVLRGARILPKELIRPWNWLDLVRCLLVPVIVRTLSISQEIALAAQIRNFGMHKQRTCWPYE